MANWLERAKREIEKGIDQGTANTDVGSLSAVTAVPNIRDEDVLTTIPMDCWNCGSNMTPTHDIYGERVWACWVCAKSA